MKPFSWSVYIFTQIAFLALHFPTTRRSLRVVDFIVLVGALFYTYRYLTLFSAGEDYVVGCSSGVLLCAAFHVVFLDREFPDDMRRAQDDGPPSEFSIVHKLNWMLALCTNMRRIGWYVQSTHRGTPSSRWKFVISRVCLAMISFILFQISVAHRIGNPSFDPRVHVHHDELYITRKPLLLRSMDVMLWVTGVVAEMSFLQSTAAALSVAIGLFEGPEDWPQLFGSPLEAFTVRRFWSQTWHQILRVPLQSYAQFVAHELFKLKRGTKRSAYMQVVVAFLVSALVHMGGDVSICNTSIPTLRFFLLQPAAIGFEDLVISMFMRYKLRWYLRRWIGYIWVMMWFCWCTPPWLDSISIAGGNVRAKIITFKMTEFLKI